jgi:light-regulated signal transduction histidine kinase (bacteriophytochrome)
MRGKYREERQKMFVGGTVEDKRRMFDVAGPKGEGPRQDKGVSNSAFDLSLKQNKDLTILDFEQSRTSRNNERLLIQRESMRQLNLSVTFTSLLFLTFLVLARRRWR